MLSRVIFERLLVILLLCKSFLISKTAIILIISVHFSVSSCLYHHFLAISWAGEELEVTVLLECKSSLYISPSHTTLIPFSGSYYFFGGLLMLLGGFLEFILGNTFPFVVFTSFGAFWLAFAATLQPFYYAYGLYAPAGQPEAAGLSTVGFTASFGFFLVFMGVLCLVYLVCSLRTNVVFVVIFFTLVVAFGLLAGAYWQNANSIANSDPSAAALAGRLQIAAGAFTFVTSMAGWWIFFAIMLAALDFPFQIPVGDLSTMIKGASERAKAKEHQV